MSGYVIAPATPTIPKTSITVHNSNNKIFFISDSLVLDYKNDSFQMLTSMGSMLNARSMQGPNGLM
jgi:hypothetical protein